MNFNNVAEMIGKAAAKKLSSELLDSNGMIANAEISDEGPPLPPTSLPVFDPNLPRRDQMIALIAIAIGTLADKLEDEQLINLLKYPQAVGPIRQTLLFELGKRTDSRRTFADPWQLWGVEKFHGYLKSRVTRPGPQSPDRKDGGSLPSSIGPDEY